METLLEKAKKVKNKSEIISDEEIELALAWIKNEITTAQVSMALRPDSKNQKYNSLYRIANCLREAFLKGLLVLQR